MRLIQEMNVRRNLRDNPEDRLQIAVVEYIRLRYPKAIIVSTYHNGARQKSFKVRARAKKMGVVRAIPDLLIFHAGKFLALELKAKNIWKKDGNLISNNHVVEQYEQIKSFRSNFFNAEFAVGFEEAKNIIDRCI